MVSYYNSLSYSQKHATPNLTYPSAPHQPWFSANYHPAAAANQQFLTGMDHPQHHQPMYYNPHMFHQSAAAADLYARENFQNLSSGQLAAHSQMFSLQQQQNQQQQQQQLNLQQHHQQQHDQQQHEHIGSGTHNHHNHHHNQQQQQPHQHGHHSQHGGQQHQSTTATGSGGSTGGNSPLDETSSSADLLTEGIPSPPITNVSGNGSEISSPGVPNAASSPQITATSVNNQNRPTPTNSPYYDWMKKPAYASQPNPGKTRTKDKYRVVYTDFQRLELEKEYHTSRYITIRRKTELAQGLQLSERQVKIWFQNRRAKERKQTKKRDDPITSAAITSSNACNGSGTGSLSAATAEDLVNFMDVKPKLENGLHHHLPHHPHHGHHHQQHSFHHHHHHQMMSLPPPMSVLHHHGHLAAAAAASAAASGNSPSTVTSAAAQHMQQVYQQMNAIESIS